MSSLGSNPGMLKYLLGRIPLQRVNHQTPAYQLLGRVGHLVPVGRVELEETGEDLIEELLLVVGAAGEWGIATEEDVHDHTNRPNVDLKSKTSLVFIHLACFFL